MPSPANLQLQPPTFFFTFTRSLICASHLRQRQATGRTALVALGIHLLALVPERRTLSSHRHGIICSGKSPLNGPPRTLVRVLCLINQQ